MHHIEHLQLHYWFWFRTCKITTPILQITHKVDLISTQKQYRCQSKHEFLQLYWRLLYQCNVSEMIIGNECFQSISQPCTFVLWQWLLLSDLHAVYSTPASTQVVLCFFVFLQSNLHYVKHVCRHTLVSI